MVADPLVIQTVDLRKHYDGVEALCGLSLDVPRGSIFGFLGRNGAGKTTTIKVLLGMARLSGGGARVFGLAADAPETSVEIRRRTGFVSDDKELYNYLTVREMTRFTAAFFPRWRKDLEERYLRVFELPAGRKGKDLSRRVRADPRGGARDAPPVGRRGSRDAERDLPRDRDRGGGLTCSGTSRGSKPDRASSSVWRCSSARRPQPSSRTRRSFSS